MKNIKMKLDMTGVDEVLKEIDYIEEVYREEVEQILYQAGLMLQAEIILKVESNVYNVPRKGEKSIEGKELTGDLKQRWATFVHRKVLDEYEIHVGSPMHYAPHLEYGTKGEDGTQWIFPRKFVEEAWLENKDRVLTFIFYRIMEVTGG